MRIKSSVMAVSRSGKSGHGLYVQVESRVVRNFDHQYNEQRRLKTEQLKCRRPCPRLPVYFVEAITGAAIVPHMPKDSDHAVEATQQAPIEVWEIRTNRPAIERTTKPKNDRKPSRQKDATGLMSCRTLHIS